jgi:hypothetical protein
MLVALLYATTAPANIDAQATDTAAGVIALVHTVPQGALALGLASNRPLRVAVEPVFGSTMRYCHRRPVQDKTTSSAWVQFVGAGLYRHDESSTSFVGHVTLVMRIGCVADPASSDPARAKAESARENPNVRHATCAAMIENPAVQTVPNVLDRGSATSSLPELPFAVPSTPISR